ncbi:MAG: protein kinase [Planctomycetota bacterium]
MDPRFARRFHREAQAAARLSHPHIVPVFEVGETQGLHYFAMQLIDGRGLDEVLREVRKQRGGLQQPAPRDGIDSTSHLSAQLASQLVHGSLALSHSGSHVTAESSRTPLDQDQPVTAAPDGGNYFRNVALIGAQVARALAYAHSEGVLHRDLKPSNLILDRSGHAWIVDFGLAKTEGMEAITQSRDVLGTPRYLAPESLRGWSDLRTDIWGLGVTLYEVLTLRPAFHGGSRVDLLRKIALEQPLPPRKIDPQIPRDLETIVLAALEKEPDRRYASGAALADDLERFLRGVAILARRAPLGHRASLFIRRHRLAATVAGSALVLLVLLLGVWGWRETLARARLEEAGERLTNALARESTARAQTEEAKRHSDENFLLALDAVDQMQLRLATYRLAGEPRLEQLQRDVLEDAARFYRKFLELRSNDPAVRYEAGLTWGRLGALEEMLAHPEEAETALREAERILRVPPGDSSRALRQRAALGLVITNRGRLAQTQGRLAEANQAFREALGVADTLTGESPVSDASFGQLLSIYETVGEFYLQTHRATEAAPVLDRGIARGIRRLGSAAATRDDEWIRRSIQACLQVRANAYHVSGQLENAEEDLKQARQQLEMLVRLAGPSPTHRWHLAELDSRLGAVLRAGQRWTEAEAAYRRALEGFDSLAEDFPSVTSMRFSAAKVRVFLGLMLQESGRSRDALPMLEEAIGELEQRIDHASPSVKEREILATAWISLGNLQRWRDEREAARAAYQAAIDQMERLREDLPSFEELEEPVAALALAYGNLGILAIDSAEFEGAEENLEESLALFAMLQERNPAKPEYAEKHLLMALGRLALLRNQGRLDEAQVYLEEVRAFTEEAETEFPDEKDVQDRAASARNTMGNLLKTLERFDEAEDELNESVRIGERLVGMNQSSPVAASMLAVSLSNLACLLNSTGRHDEALLHAERAMVLQRQALSQDAQNTIYRSRLAWHHGNRCDALARLGRLDEALAAAREERDTAPHNAETLLDAALCFSMCAGLSSAEQATQCAEEAMACLHRAVASGLTRLDRLRTEESFKPLRGRVDFQDLLKSLE